jgi:hypothetical protein
MNIPEAIAILRRHNEWRRGHEQREHQAPAEIGRAIDIVLAAAEERERLATALWTGKLPVDTP